MEMTSIYFNNKNSYIDLDLAIEKAPSFPVSYENIEQIPVEGRSGALTRRLGTFNDKSITVTFRLNTESDYYRRIDEIIEWLNYIDDNSLVFSFDTERKYIVKVIQGSDSISKIRKWSDSFQITFVCDPFKYPIDDTIVTSTASSFTIYNSGSVKTEPYIKVVGSGNITLTINNKSIIFTGVVDYIELDSMFFLCYKSTTNEMSKMNGDFPALERGSNSISSTGTVTSIEVHVRERYL